MDAHNASKPSSGSSRRKRKKRRKRKLPKAGCRLFPPGCRRLCDHQRQVPAVSPQTLGIPVMMQRQVPTVHSFMLLVQFLDTVLDMPVVVLRQVPGLMVQKTVARPQLQSIEGRRHSAEAVPHGPVSSPDHRDSPVAVRFQVVDVPVVRVVQFLLCCRGDVLGAPTVAAR